MGELGAGIRALTPGTDHWQDVPAARICISLLPSSGSNVAFTVSRAF
jgi:hypothetical protein